MQELLTEDTQSLNYDFTQDKSLSVVKQIGDGFFSKVLLVERKVDQEWDQVLTTLPFQTDSSLTKSQLALKLFEKNEYKKIGVKEYQFLKNAVSHPNIIKVLDYQMNGIQKSVQNLNTDQKAGFNQQYDYMTMEYCSKGDLFYMIKKNGKLKEDLAKYLFMQILEAIGYMHSILGMAHLDIKLENILFDENFNLKLCDFGFIEELKTKVHKNIGTDGYKAPEIYLSNGYREGFNADKADIFALGVILFILIFGVPPFTIATSDNALYKVFYRDRKYHQYFFRVHPMTKQAYQNGEIPVALAELFLAIFDADPTFRPQSIQAIKDHEYFKGEMISHEEAKLQLRQLYGEE